MSLGCGRFCERSPFPTLHILLFMRSVTDSCQVDWSMAGFSNRVSLALPPIHRTVALPPEVF